MTETEHFTEFMRKYQQMVYGTALRLLAHPTEAEDVAQEVFLRAHKHFAEIATSPTAGGWLKKVTTNICLNHLSRYRSRWTFFSDFFRGGDDEERSFVDEIPAEEGPDRFATEERNELVQNALQKLSPAQRVPLVLYHFENKSYEEIAEMLGVSLGKVKTDIFRAREALRKRLRIQMDDDAGDPARRLPLQSPAVKPRRNTRTFASQLLSATV